MRLYVLLDDCELIITVSNDPQVILSHADENLSGDFQVWENGKLWGNTWCNYDELKELCQAELEMKK